MHWPQSAAGAIVAKCNEPCKQQLTLAMTCSHSSSVMNFLNRNARGCHDSSTTSPVHLSYTVDDKLAFRVAMAYVWEKNELLSRPRLFGALVLCLPCHVHQRPTQPCLALQVDRASYVEARPSSQEICLSPECICLLLVQSAEGLGPPKSSCMSWRPCSQPKRK